MAISTYSELQTAVENWADDSSQTARVPEAITMAEGVLNRKLRGMAQQVIATASYATADDSRFIAKPSGFIEMIDLAYKKATENDTEYKNIDYVPPESIVPYYKTAGEPDVFTVRNQIEFNRKPDVNYTLRMHYLKGLDIASDSTNWLLTDYPDAYLTGSLYFFFSLNHEFQAADWWEGKFKMAISELDDLEDRNRDDAVLDVSDLSDLHYQTSSFNIITNDY